jgi:glycosyltransferase involved in cell wall biosynthesis
MQNVNSDIAVVIPTYNEGVVIKEVVNNLLSYNFVIIVVDDGSKDNTEELLSDLPIFYLRHKLNLGQGAAIATGLRFVSSLDTSCVVTFDADGQHDPEDIIPMVTKMKNDNLDIIFGSRFLKYKPANLSFVKLMLLKAAIIFNYLTTGILLSDAHNGLRVIHHRVLPSLQLSENKMSHATEILMEVKRLNLKYAEVAMRMVYTDYSKQKGQKISQAIPIFFDILLAQMLR